MPAQTVEKSKPLRYVEMPPAPDVAALVATYWSFTARSLPSPDFTHRVWPDGCTGLVIGRIPVRGCISRVVGASTSASEVPLFVGSHYWGIRFRPDAGGPCCARDAVALRDTSIEAEECFGAALAPLQAALLALPDTEDDRAATVVLDAWVRALLPRAVRIDPLVTAAVDQIVASDGTATIASIAARLAISPRHLQRRFRSATGLSPKEYASIRRGRAALKRLATADDRNAPVALSRLAADTGYADQSHLTRECARLTTFTPASLIDRLGDITHDRLVD